MIPKSYDLDKWVAKYFVSKNERKELVKNAIHRNSFNIPLYYCNSSTPIEIIDKIQKEHRITVTSKINDAKTSLSSRQMDRAASITKDANSYHQL